jgi:uncharacterized protein YecE (DUF72 family)
MLQNAGQPLRAFLAETDGLAQKRGPILVQLPPSLVFDASVVTSFLQLVREVYDGPIVCEPRHATWFAPPVAALLDRFRISRVAADPPPAPTAGVPSAWPGLVYFRLHGSPHKYWSRYEEHFILSLAATIRGITTAEDVWCVFDNTARGAAIENASELQERLIEAPMPFKSQAQRRKFAQLLVEGKISNETFEEWNRETGRKKLPERVGSKAKSSAAKSQRRRTPRKRTGKTRA